MISMNSPVPPSIRNIVTSHRYGPVIISVKLKKAFGALIFYCQQAFIAFLTSLDLRRDDTSTNFPIPDSDPANTRPTADKS